MVCYDNAVKTCNIKLIKLNIYRPCVLDLLSIKRSFRVVLPPNNDSIIFYEESILVAFGKNGIILADTIGGVRQGRIIVNSATGPQLDALVQDGKPGECTKPRIEGFPTGNVRGVKIESQFRSYTIVPKGVVILHQLREKLNYCIEVWCERRDGTTMAPQWRKPIKQKPTHKKSSQRPRRTLSVLTGIRLKGGKGGVMPPFCSDVAWYPRRAKTLVRRKSMRETLVDMLERMEKRSESQKHRRCKLLLLLLDVPCRRNPKQTPSLLDISPATHVRVCPSSDKGKTGLARATESCALRHQFPRSFHATTTKKRARRSQPTTHLSFLVGKRQKNGSGPRVVRIG